MLVRRGKALVQWPHMRCILLLFTLFGALLGQVEAAGTRALPIVLASRVDLRLADGGVRARIWVETHASQAPSAPFPVVSGAGSLLQWRSSATGAFRMVDPTDTAPGSPAFVQRVAGRAQLTLELWQPLAEAEEELVMRLPPTPEGTWSLEGLKEGALVDTGDAGAQTVPVAGKVEGETPDDGLLWLSWGGRERASTAGFLEASRVDLYVRSDAVHYKARLQGFQPTGQLAVHWAPSFRPAPPVEGEGGSARTFREDGVDLHGLTSEWFDETFEGTVQFDDVGEVLLELPRVAGLARARVGQVTIHPEVPRSLRLLPSKSPGGNLAWTDVPMPEGRRRVRLASRAQAVPLRFRVSGTVHPSSGRLRVVRTSARSAPIEGEAEAKELVRTRLEFKVAGATKNFSLHFPETVRVAQARWNASRVSKMPKDVAAGTTIDFRVEGEGKFVLEFFHGDPRKVPVYGTLHLVLPRPLELREEEGPPEKRYGLLDSGHFEWSGRLPGNVEVLAPAEVGGFPGERSPYPLRWTVNFFDGVQVVLREAGVVVAFGLALLLGLYASLFLRPPNKQAVYMLAFGIAVFGLIYNLFQAAGQAAVVDPAAPGGTSVLPNVVERMRTSARRITDFIQPGESRPGASGAGAHDHGVRDPADPGFGGLLDRRMWSQGPEAESPAARARARIQVDAQGRALTPDGVFGLDMPPPISDDWSLIRIPTRAAPVGQSLQLIVGQSMVVQAAAMLLGVLVLVGAVLARQSGGPTPIIVMTAGALLLIPIDLAFPRSSAPGASLVLVSLLGVVLHRAVTDGMALWEEVRQKLESRRLKALSHSGGGMGGNRDTAGGAYSGSALQKNEATYEDVFPDDEGITFIMGEA